MSSILIVDDEPSVRTIFARWAEHCGHSVTMAASADEALASFDAAPVEIAVCDVSMPGHDGWWLAERIRERSPATAVIMTTGYSAQNFAAGSYPATAGILEKPFTRDALMKAVEGALAWRARAGAEARTVTA